MKDYHLPAAVTIPAAIGLVGVLWLLHRKSSSNEGKSKPVTALPKEQEWNSKDETGHVEADGITISQRKIPETLARDRGSSDLKCKKSTDLPNGCQVKSFSEKQDTKSDRYFGGRQELVEAGCDGRNDMTSTDQTLVAEKCGFVTLNGSESKRVEASTNIAVVDEDDGLVLESTPLRGGGGDLTSARIIQNGQTANITEFDQSYSVTSSGTFWCSQRDGSKENIAQHDNLSESFMTQSGQGCRVSETSQTGEDCLPTLVNIQECKNNGQMPTIAQNDKLKLSITECGQDGSLTSSQRMFLEQQVIMAVGDGLKEAHRQISQPPDSLTDLKQTSLNSETPDLPHDADQSVLWDVPKDYLEPKTATFELESSVNTHHKHGIDPKSKISTADLPKDGAKDLIFLPSLKDSFVDHQTDTVSLDSSISGSTNKIMVRNSSSIKESSAALQKSVKSSSPGESESPVRLPSSTSAADSQPHVNISNQATSDLNLANNLQVDDQSGSHVISNGTIESSSVNADPKKTPCKTTEDAVLNTNRVSVSSIQSEVRSAGQWLPKASSSSVDSFGPEEIEAIWGIKSSMDDLDKELFFMDEDPVEQPLAASSLLEQTSGLDINQEVGQTSQSSLLCEEDQIGAIGSSKEKDVHSLEIAAGELPDKSLQADSLAKSNSPLGDNSSEGSNDSGRGGSEHDVTFAGNETLVQFDFNIPSEICGQFIGKHGKNINYLKSKSGAHVSLTNDFYTPGYQVCKVSGTQAEVDDALSMIRRKFPLQDYPLLTMIPVNLPVPVPLQPDNQFVYPEVMQLSLPEGVSVDVFVSAIVDAGQVFVQQPTHRSFMSLEKLNYFLNLVYAQDPNVPSVPLPIESGIICVCESEGFWYRAMIMSSEDENGEVQVKFVDYGGYVTLPVSALKQIRADFMNLPFQAVECFMANITPSQSEKFFSNEATQTLSEMTQGKLLQCQVVARTEYGVPYIHLYHINAETSSAILINQALVNSRLVRWIEIL